MKTSKLDKPHWLTHEWLAGQESKLRAMRDRLRTEIDRGAEQMGEIGTSDPREPGDIAQEDRQDFEAAESMAVSQTRWGEVESALRRIPSGDYGVCSDCRHWITRERLEANPAAERCLPCQEAREKGRRPTPAGA